ncbi:MAG TPA: hypothetical protein PKN33_03145 [Phycisphaerae bacterium]|nr:hypothetical protein [Phycisphaerae bacterium]
MRIVRVQPNSIIHCNALALVEVVAAIVLLSTVACGLLVAHARSLRALSDGVHAEHASELARELIAYWKLNDTITFSSDEGVIDGEPNWIWQRNILSTAPRFEKGDWARIELVLSHQMEGDGASVSYAFEWIEGLNEDALESTK